MSDDGNGTIIRSTNTPTPAQDAYIDGQMAEAMQELSDCREDARNSDEQLFQIIAAATTAISVIYGASIGTTTLHLAAFMLSGLIFSAAFLYVITLGIQNVLRFHYIRDMEDRIAKFKGEAPRPDDVIHWMSFSSPVTTRNIAHVRPGYTMIHFACYMLAILFVSCICGSILFMQYNTVKAQLQGSGFDVLAFIVMIIMGAALVLFFVLSSRAGSMFQYANRVGRLQRNRRLGYAPKREKGVLRRRIAARWRGPRRAIDARLQRAKALLRAWKDPIAYFAYPKWKDVQKGVLVVLGCVTGSILRRGSLAPSWELVGTSALCWLVIEYLIYQARYQVNDLRGIEADKNDPNKKKIHFLADRRWIIASLVILCLRIVAAYVIAIGFCGAMGKALFVCMTAILALAVAYETARGKRWGKLTLVLVSLGYPLRLIGGMWAAWPAMWSDRSALPVAVWASILLLAYACYGEMAVTIPWVKDAIDIVKRKGCAGATFDDPNKPHFQILHASLDDARASSPDPLTCKGRVRDIWNLSFLLAMIFASVVAVLSISWPGVPMPPMAMEMAIVAGAVFACRARKAWISIWSALIMVAVAAKVILSIRFLHAFGLYAIVGIHQILFAATYLMLRQVFQPMDALLRRIRAELTRFGRAMLRLISKMGRPLRMCIAFVGRSLMALLCTISGLIVGQEIWDAYIEGESKPIGNDPHPPKDGHDVGPMV